MEFRGEQINKRPSMIIEWVPLRVKATRLLTEAWVKASTEVGLRVKEPRVLIMHSIQHSWDSRLSTCSGLRPRKLRGA